MFRSLVNAALVISLVLIGQASKADMHATPEFVAGKTRPRTIAFLPPHASVAERRMIRLEQHADEGAELADCVAVSLKSAFAAQGYEVTVLTSDDVNASPELQELVLEADRRYAELLNELRLKLPKQIAAHRYVAGDEMRLLAAKLGVDAIGFADLQIVSSFMPGGGTSSMLSVSVIDGGTATIEAYFVPPLLKRGGFAGTQPSRPTPRARSAK